ncbi:pentapeptide repeat-containing protein, partial [Crocosphaera sp. Alani8]|uniref:pentapeptide repeat-containing protein n=1 Tax=Crocosphaera sp. Alani8 TaxID=3038952 RepID=UPI00313E9C56
MRVYGKLQVAIYSCYSLLLEDFRDIFMGTGQEKLTQLKNVSEFFNEALKLKENDVVKTIAEGITNATPWFQEIAKNASWVKDVTEAAEGTIPLLPFFLKYAQLLTLERDPQKQGYNACTLAYNRAIQEAFFNFSMKLQHIKPRANVRIISKKNPENIDMTGFKLDNTSLYHEFIQYADDAFYQFAEINEIDQKLTNQLLKNIRSSFFSNLRLLLVHPYTEKEFSAFKALTFLDNSKTKLEKILDRHLEYQCWLFNEKNVFRSEPFALNHIYLNTECGTLKYSEIKSQTTNKSGDLIDNQDSEKLKNPFSEKDAKRVDLLNTVLKYMGKKKFNEPIIIQGVAGSGKSSFTLKLVEELKEQGCYPIRILLKDLNLIDNFKDAVPYALKFGEEHFGQSSWKPIFDGKWFSELVNPANGEAIKFGEDNTEISPYVFIFDGWDEISTAANQGFRDSIDQLLNDIRDTLIEKRNGYTPIRVIVTGRPTVDVTNTKLLRKDTPILTIRPLRPEQLKTYIDTFQKANQTKPLLPLFSSRFQLQNSDNKIINPEFIKKIIDTYQQAFTLLISEHKQDNVSELKGSLAVLGLPLLAYLTLTLMLEISSEEELKALIDNPTNLYRKLIDKTCNGSGKAVAELEEDNHFQLSGKDLRGLLWKTAQAITDLGKESISREELRLRLFPEADDDDDQLEEIIEEATANNKLSCLIISFFFKESAGEGCKFLHKSFREYLFAEAVIEELKWYGKNPTVAKVYEHNPQKGYQERELYWQDFKKDDPRWKLTRYLSKQFATHWVSPEIKSHLLSLLTWEMERSAKQESNQQSVSSLSTEPIFRQQWEYIRDGLADVWDWWGEGVFMRSQARIKKGDKHFDAPYVMQLAEWCCPLDSQAWKPNLPAPVRHVTVDSKLGDAFFHLTAIVHGQLYDYARQKVSPSIDISTIEPRQRRRYQTEQVARDGNNKEISLIQFAPSGENDQYFRNYCHRINATGLRLPFDFPGQVWASLVNLSGADISGVNLYRANLSEANLSEANLSGADISEVNLYKANLSKATLSRATLSRATLSKAILSGADISGADLYRATLGKATFSEAKLSGADFYGADLYGAELSGADLYKAKLSRAKNLPLEHIKNKTRNWYLLKKPGVTRCENLGQT